MNPVRKRLFGALLAVIIIVASAPLLRPVRAQSVDLLTRLTHIETALWGTDNTKKINGGAISTVPGTVTAQTCGTTTTCSHTATGPALKIVYGRVALSSASPSIAAITGISPAFTNNGTYHCVTDDRTDITHPTGVLAAGYVSGSAFTITGPNTVTDTVDYVCTGN